jgi:hypothetical protein
MWKIKYLLLKISDFFLSNLLFVNLLFLYNCLKHKKSFYFLNITKPNTFNEKINFIKFSIKNPLSIIVADKIKVRDFVEKKIGEKYLIPLLAVFNSPEEIYLKNLPSQFVMKLNNGSGINFISHENLNYSSNNTIYYYFKKRFIINPYYFSREWHYGKIENKILIEKYLGNNILDYKIFCFNGVPGFVQVDFDRFLVHRRNIYDINWVLLEVEYVYPRFLDDPIPKPNKFNTMIEIAQKLSEDFLFARIDLYIVDNIIYFGEITLHPEGGLGPFDTKSSDIQLGKFLILD